MFGKVASGASAALQAITKPAAPPKPARPPPPQAPLAPPLFGNGLLGRALGGLVMNAAKGLSEQLAAAARETQNIYEAAAAAIEADSRVAAALGAVSVGPPVSQSSSSSSVNGRVTKRVVLVSPQCTPCTVRCALRAVAVRYALVAGAAGRTA